MKPEVSASLLREPPLLLLGALALAQSVLLATLARGMLDADDAFLAGPIALVAGVLAVFAAIHTFALWRRAGSRRFLVYTLLAVLFAGVGVSGPIVAEGARASGALRDIRRVGAEALRREGLAILEKYKNRGVNPEQVPPQDWGPALLALKPVRVLRFPSHVKVRLYGLETAHWGVWLMAEGFTIDATPLAEGAYWVTADEFGYMLPVAPKSAGR